MLDIILFDMLVVEPRKSASDTIKQISKPKAEAKMRINAFKLAGKLRIIQQKEDAYFSGHGTKVSEKAIKQPQTLTLKGPAELIKNRSKMMSKTSSNGKEKGGT